MSGGLAVLIYHRVGSSPDPLRPRMATAEEFRRQMRVLRRFFRPVALEEGMTFDGSTIEALDAAVVWSKGRCTGVEGE